MGKLPAALGRAVGEGDHHQPGGASSNSSTSLRPGMPTDNLKKLKVAMTGFQKGGLQYYAVQCARSDFPRLHLHFFPPNVKNLATMAVPAHQLP